MSKTLRECILVDVEYTKTSGGEEEVTERTILPTYVPQPKHRNVRALDVTDLSAEDRADLHNLLVDYNEYLKASKKEVFTFEEFIERVTGDDPPELKWRTFKPDQLKQL